MNRDRLSRTPGRQPYDALVGARVGAMTGGITGALVGAATIGRFEIVTLLAGALVGGAVGYLVAKQQN